jgi:hypothetical protein
MDTGEPDTDLAESTASVTGNTSITSGRPATLAPFSRPSEKSGEKKFRRKSRLDQALDIHRKKSRRVFPARGMQ